VPRPGACCRAWVYVIASGITTVRLVNPVTPLAVHTWRRNQGTAKYKTMEIVTTLSIDFDRAQRLRQGRHTANRPPTTESPPTATHIPRLQPGVSVCHPSPLKMPHTLQFFTEFSITDPAAG